MHAFSPKYRPEIDGLRAIAVLIVVGYHAFPNWLKGGFIGVDIFFVISGFLISTILIQSLDKNGRISYLDFYSRRIRRIFPALIVVSVASLGWAWYVLLPDEFEQTLKHAAAGAGFVANFSLWDEAGYFDRGAETKIFLHLWSLAIEEQFYLVWPIALGLFWKVKRLRILFISVCLIGSFAYSAYLISRGQRVEAFYSPISRFWELGVGGLLALLNCNGISAGKWSTVYSIVGLGLVVFGLFAINKATLFPGMWALVPVIGATLIIFASSNSLVNKYFLSIKPMRAVGKISYPLYLWHWPVLVFAGLIFGSQGIHMSPSLRAGLVSLCLLLASITYLWIELPLRKFSPRFLAIGLATSLGVVGMVALLGYFYHLQPRLSHASVTKIVNAVTDWQYPPARFYAFGNPLSRIWLQQSRSEQKTLFIGDSNIEQYATRVEALVANSPKTFNSAMFATEGGCPITPSLFAIENDCRAKMTLSIKLAERDDVKVVVLGQNWLSYPMLVTNKDHRDSLKHMIAKIAQSKKVFILLNMPGGDELDPRGMYSGSRLSELRPKLSKELGFDLVRFEDKRSAINKVLSDIAAETGALLIDPIPTLCPKGECPILDQDGSPLYRDPWHMRPFYVLRAATYLDQTLLPVSP